MTDALAMAAQWWEASGRSAPRRPMMVIWCHDDPAAVSTLPHDHGRTWPGAMGSSGPGRLCEYLDVEVRAADGDLDLAEADLVLLAEVGRGLTTVGAAQAVRAYDQEPQRVTGRGSGIDDVAWMDKVVQVRESAKREPPSPLPAMSAFLDRCRESGTPVLLDGVATAAAASLCQDLPHAASPLLGDEPAHAVFLQRMDMPAWSTGTVGGGLGALTGLGLLRLALAAYA